MSDLLNSETDPENGTEPECILESQLNYLNPLVIPEIVREIMKFIQPKDLSKYRLVCRTWNEVIIPQIKNRSTFYFDTFQKIDDFMKNGQILFGFRNLNLKYPPPNNSEWRDPSMKLFSSHGKLLRRLHLDYGSITMVICSIKYIYPILANSLELEYFKFTNLIYVAMNQIHLESFPSIVAPPITLYKLTTLDIDLYPMPLYGPADLQTQEFYTQVLRIAPNLKELQLKSSNHEARRGTSFHSCIRALMTVNPPHLKRVYFHCLIPVELAEELSTRLTSNIQKLVVDDLDSLFILKFDAVSLTGNKIEITAMKEIYSGIPASDVINYIENRLAECETGVSCTHLLETFLFAFQDKIQIQAAGLAHVHLTEDH